MALFTNHRAQVRWILHAALGSALLFGLEPAAHAADELLPAPRIEAAASLPTGVRLRLGTTQFRGAGDIKCVAFAPDGRILALAGADRLIRFWEPGTGREIRILSGHEDTVSSLAFSADGKLLASGSYDRTVRLWDTATGKQLHQLTTDYGWVTTVAISPDGKQVAAGGRHRAIHLWDIATEKELWKLQRPVWITSLVFSTDGQTLVSAGKSDGVRLWETASGQEVARLEGHAGPVHALAVAPNGQMLASAGSDRTVRLWDMNTRKELRKLEGHRGSIFALQFTTDGQALISGSADGTVCLWEAATGKERLTIPTARGEVVAVALSPDGRTLASAAYQCQLAQLWDLATGKEHDTANGHGAGVTTVAFSPDGTTLASGSKDRSLRLWNLTTGQERRTLNGHQSSIFTLAFSPDGRHLASTGQRRTARLWETATGKQLAPLDAEDWILGFSFSADSQVRAWTTGAVRNSPQMRFGFPLGSGQALQLLDWSSGKEVHSLKVTESPVMPIINAQGNAVPVRRPTGHQMPIGAVAYSSRRDLVASGSHDKSIGLWRLQTGKFLAHLDGHEGAVSRLAFSDDDRFLASVGDDRTLRVWEVATFRTLWRITRLEDGEVRAIALSPDGRFLAWAGGTHHAIHLVDLAGVTKERILAGHTGLVTALAFAPHGRWLASGSDDTTVLVWDLPSLPAAQAVPRPPLEASERDRHWNKLVGSEDVSGVYDSLASLLAEPDRMPAFLKARLTEGKKVKPVAQLIAELDDPQFVVRTRAFEELETLGDIARSDVLKAIEGKPSLEVRQRLDDLLRLLDQRHGRPSPDDLRQIRSVQALEWLGTPPARQVLDELAGGSPTKWQTQEARSALQRLDKK